MVDSSNNDITNYYYPLLNVGQNSYMAHPIRANIGPMTAGLPLEEMDKKIMRIRGHYPSLDESMKGHQSFAERNMKIDNNQVCLVDDPEKRLRVLMHSRARQFTIVQPRQHFDPDAETMFDIPIRGFKEVDPFADAMLGAVQIISGLLGQKNIDSGITDEGIGLCYGMEIPSDNEGKDGGNQKKKKKEKKESEEEKERKRLEKDAKRAEKEAEKEAERQRKKAEREAKKKRYTPEEVINSVMIEQSSSSSSSSHHVNGSEIDWDKFKDAMASDRLPTKTKKAVLKAATDSLLGSSDVPLEASDVHFAGLKAVLSSPLIDKATKDKLTKMSVSILMNPKTIQQMSGEEGQEAQNARKRDRDEDDEHSIDEERQPLSRLRQYSNDDNESVTSHARSEAPTEQTKTPQLSSAKLTKHFKIAQELGTRANEIQEDMENGKIPRDKGMKELKKLAKLDQENTQKLKDPTIEEAEDDEDAIEEDGEDGDDDGQEVDQIFPYPPNVTISGEYDHPFYFTIEHTNPENGEKTTITMDRYLWDEEIIDEDDDDSIPNDRPFKFARPVMSLIHVWIIDPRLSITRGLSRIIRRNTRASLLSKRAKLPTNINGTSKVDDSALCHYNPRHFNHYFALTSWATWSNILATLSTQFENFQNSFGQVVDRKGLYKNGSIMDPCISLNGNRLFVNNPLRYQYNSLIGDDLARSLAWTDEKFYERIGKNWINRTKSVVFLSRDDFNKVGVEPFDEFSSSSANALVIEDDKDIDVYEKFEVEQVPPSYELKIFIYPNCNRVVRPNKICIGSYKTPSRVFPFLMTRRFIRMGTLNSTKNVPFPPLDSVTFVKWQSLLNRVISQLSNPTVSSVYESAVIPSDVILRRYFCEPTPSPDTSKFIDEDKPTSSLRRFEVFTNMWDTLRSSNCRHPTALRSVLKYLESRPHGSSIFPDMYASRANGGFGFKYYGNLSIYSNWMVNYIQRYVEGEPFQCFMHHKNIIMIIYAFASQYRGKYGYQPTFILYGPATETKTHSVNGYIVHGIPDTIHAQDSASLCANSSTNGDDGKFTYQDDVTKMHPLLSPDSAISGPYKTAITAGKTTRNVLNLGQNGSRLNLPIVTSCRGVTVMASNLPYSAMPDFTRTRCTPLYAYTDPKFKRTETVTLDDGNHESEFGQILKAYQSFCALLGSFVACGAIVYDFKKYPRCATTLITHINKILKHQYIDCGVMDERLRQDKIKSLLYSIAVHRVWVQICSGVWRDLCPVLSPNAPLSMDTFIAIHHFGLLTNTEEDAYVTCSFLEDVFPFAGKTTLTLFLLRACRKQGYTPGMTPDEFTKLTCFYESYVPEPGVAEGFNYGAGGGGVRRTDYELIDTGIIAYDNNFNFDSSVAEIIHQEFPHISTDELKIAIVDLKGQVHTFKCLIKDDGFNQYHFEHEANGSSKILRAIKIPNTEQKRLFVLRSWVDQFTNEEGFFNQPQSMTDPRFLSSPMENAIVRSMYDGQDRRDYVLPGMNCARPFNRTNANAFKVMPQVCKIVKAGDLTIDVHDPILAVPNLSVQSIGKWTQGSWQDGCMKNVLRDRLKEFHYDLNENGQIDFSIAPSLTGENENINNYLTEYMNLVSPGSCEQRFEDQMRRDEEAPTYPEHSIVLYGNAYVDQSKPTNQLPEVDEY